MDAKLTIRLNQEVIENAKKYAASQNRSLSRLIESYLSSLVETEKESNSQVTITPFVKNLGIKLPIPADFDEKKAYKEYQEEKHR